MHVDQRRFRRTLQRAVIPPVALITVLTAVLVGTIANLLHTSSWVADCDRVIAEAIGLQHSAKGIELQISAQALGTGPLPLLADEQAAERRLHALKATVEHNPDRQPLVQRVESRYRAWHDELDNLKQSLETHAWGGVENWRSARDAMHELHLAIESLLHSASDSRDQRVMAARRTTTVALVVSAGLTFLVGIGIVWSAHRQFMNLMRTYDQALRRAREQHEAVRTSEARFRNLFEATMVGSVVVDHEGVVYDANDAYLKITGYARDDIRTRCLRWTQLIAPDQPVSRRQLVEELVATGVLKPVEVEALRRDGTRVPVLCGAKRFDDGSKHGIGFMVDLSEAKRTERERTELASRERHRLTQIRRIAAASLAISSDLELDAMLRVITASAAEIIGAHQAVTGIVIEGDREHVARYRSSKCDDLPEVELMPSGSPARQSVCETNQAVCLSDDALAADPAWDTVRTGTSVGSSMRGWLAVPLVARDGRNMGLIQLSDKFSGDFDEEDRAMLTQLAQMASVAIENARLYSSLRERDQEREQLLERERRARADAERASLMKDEFLSNLSHELRTPLNAIMGWSELLCDDQHLSEEATQAIEIIQRNAHLQLQLVNDLLDMSRIVSGKMQLETQLLDIAMLVEQGLESVRPSADQKSVVIERHFSMTDALIVGDAARLQQVVWNLLTNAIKFTQPGGRIAVSLRSMEDHIELEVSDTGMGMERDFLPFVFDRFRQADASSRRQHGGLGLGLAIVKQLVELHGGTITAASAGPGQGSTFVVSLPLATGNIDADPAVDLPLDRQPDSTDLLEGMTVLVAEADTEMRRRVATLLAQAGARAIMATSATEGYDLLVSEHPDVLISGLEAAELVRRIRRDANPHVARTPAIAIAEGANRKSGYDLCLTRPVIPAQLLAAVSRLVDGRSVLPGESPPPGGEIDRSLLSATGE